MIAKNTGCWCLLLTFTLPDGIFAVKRKSEYALVAPRTYSGPIEGFWGGEEGAGGG